MASTVRTLTYTLVVLAVVLALVSGLPAEGDDLQIPQTLPPQQGHNPASSLFDDIFNIPIQVLTAVRRLLNNGANNLQAANVQAASAHPEGPTINQ